MIHSENHENLLGYILATKHGQILLCLCETPKQTTHSAQYKIEEVPRRIRYIEGLYTQGTSHIISAIHLLPSFNALLRTTASSTNAVMLAAGG